MLKKFYFNISNYYNYHKYIIQSMILNKKAI